MPSMHGSAARWLPARMHSAVPAAVCVRPWAAEHSRVRHNLLRVDSAG